MAKDKNQNHWLKTIWSGSSQYGGKKFSREGKFYHPWTNHNPAILMSSDRRKFSGN